jgi:hypothetical protein
MAQTKRPGALTSHRAGEIVLGGTSLHTIVEPSSQRFNRTWRVNRWLNVEWMEVR